MEAVRWRDPNTLAGGTCGGRFCVVMKFLYTHALLVDYSSDQWSYYYSARYCYASAHDAFAALREWNGVGDPPHAWIKEKVSDRLGPGALR